MKIKLNYYKIKMIVNIKCFRNSVKLCSPSFQMFLSCTCLTLYYKYKHCIFKISIKYMHKSIEPIFQNEKNKKIFTLFTSLRSRNLITHNTIFSYSSTRIFSFIVMHISYNAILTAVQNKTMPSNFLCTKKVRDNFRVAVNLFQNIVVA